MLMKWTSKLFFKNLTKAISFAISLIVVFTLFSSPSIAAKTAMTGDYTKDTISVVKTSVSYTHLTLPTTTIV